MVLHRCAGWLANYILMLLAPGDLRKYFLVGVLFGVVVEDIELVVEKKSELVVGVALMGF